MNIGYYEYGFCEYCDACYSVDTFSLLLSKYHRVGWGGVIFGRRGFNFREKLFPKWLNHVILSEMLCDNSSFSTTAQHVLL